MSPAGLEPAETTQPPTSCVCRAASLQSTRWRAWSAPALGVAPGKRPNCCARYAHRQSSRASRASRARRDLLQRLAGGRRRQPRRRDVSRPESLSRQQRPVGRRAHQQCVGATRPNRIPRRERRSPLVPSHRRRRRSRLRRTAQRVRIDEGDDLRRRGGRALRRSAEFREKVRTSGRESPDSDATSRAPPRRGASRRRRPRRSHDRHRTHRRERSQTHHQRRGSGRSRVSQRRTHGRRVFRHASGHGGVHRAGFSVRTVRRPRVDGDVRAQSRGGRTIRRSDPRGVSR